MILADVLDSDHLLCILKPKRLQDRDDEVIRIFAYDGSDNGFMVGGKTIYTSFK